MHCLLSCRLDMVASTALEDSGIHFVRELTLLEHLDLGGFERVSDATIEVGVPS